MSVTEDTMLKKIATEIKDFALAIYYVLFIEAGDRYTYYEQREVAQR